MHHAPVKAAQIRVPTAKANLLAVSITKPISINFKTSWFLIANERSKVDKEDNEISILPREKSVAFDGSIGGIGLLLPLAVLANRFVADTTIPSGEHGTDSGTSSENAFSKC